MEQKNNTRLEMGLFDDGPYEVGDENRLDPNLVPVPANSYLGEREKPCMSVFVCAMVSDCIVTFIRVCDTEFRACTGFSLDSGHIITEKGRLIIVSGAPRANHSGAVVFLRTEGEMSTTLTAEHVLEGPGLASSFGYDVTVVDLNGDGWVRHSISYM